MAKFPLLNYVIGTDSNYGIAEGRNRAIQLVKTKYFLLMDDDVTVIDTADIKTMVDILDTTDASVVGGSLQGRLNIAGFLKFGYFGGTTRKLGLFNMCAEFNRTLPSHPECYQCDLNLNLFMARTKEVLATGGWNPELKVLEHKDIYIKMKMAGLKLAVCPLVKFDHLPPGDNSEMQGIGYAEKRHNSYVRFTTLLPNFYNVHNIFISHNAMIDEHGTITFSMKEGNSHC